MDAAQLAAEIRRHDKLYYEEGAPEISDDTYDAMRKRLQQLDPSNPILNMVGYASHDAAEVSGTKATRRSVEHIPRMLSLKKVSVEGLLKPPDKAAAEETAMIQEDTEENSLERWVQGEEIRKEVKPFGGIFTGTPKIDGLACCLRYAHDGSLILAATRGDGEKGDNVTDNARYVGNIPAHIPAQGVDIEIRGEIYMPLSSFWQFDSAKSPRNMAVGGMRQKDSKETASFGLKFFAFDILHLNLDTEEQKFAKMRELGFEPAPHTLLSEDTLSEYCARMLKDRESWDFEADGLVFKANAVALHRTLGETDHHPRYAIAYKFPTKRGITTLLDIEWQVAKTGAITPVAVFAPTLLDGAILRRATLVHAAHAIEKLALHAGDKILVSRRGGVIPCVEKVIEQNTAGNVFEAPSTCPSCGAPACREGLSLMCSIPENCPSMGQALIENFVKVVECMGFGEKIIANLYDNDLVTTPADLYRLKLEDLAIALSQSGNSDAVLPQKLYDSIQAARKMTLAQFLEALSIPALGKVTANDLAENFGTLEALLEASLDELVKALYETDEQEPADKTYKAWYSKIQSATLLSRESVRDFWLRVINRPNSILEKEAQAIEKRFSDIPTLLAASRESVKECLKQNRQLAPATRQQRYSKIHTTPLVKGENVASFWLRATSQPMKDACAVEKEFSDISTLQMASWESLKACIERERFLEKVVRARNIYDGLHQKRATLISNLRTHVEIDSPSPTTLTEGRFSGMTFVFSDIFESIEYGEATRAVQVLGGRIVSGVSKNVNVLVTTATSSLSSKLARAVALNASGAKIILWTEEEFLKEVNAGMEALKATDEDEYQRRVKATQSEENEKELAKKMFFVRRAIQARDSKSIGELPSTPEEGIQGKIFLFTGTLSSMKRKEAQQLVESMGGKIASGVSANLDVLVSTSTTSTKWKMAEALNASEARIALWTEEDFLKAIKQPSLQDQTDLIALQPKL
ncbi:MAG: NAD-dependent DNA ligase LigA [Proteobacteria bacterium]|nr:NAD-dependent DNA ligase LigA [Pseudomonadota bacterium]